MNLKEMVAQILQEGFNPETDSVNDFDNLPDGIYDALFTNVSWRTNDNGSEWLSLEFEILNEGYEGRKYFGNIFFSVEKMLQVNIKRTMKYAAILGVTLGPDDFADPEQNLVEAFKNGLGNQVELELKTSKKGFQNFELSDGVPF
jgi:hypothetical protein